MSQPPAPHLGSAGNALHAPAARRLRAPSWRDRRLVVGLVLVLSSVALGAAVVGRADDTAPVFVADHSLVPGQPLRADDLRVVRVQLGGQQGRYLGAASAPAPGSVVIRSVQAGELVPSSAVGRPDAVTSRPVAVPVPAGAAQGLRPGSLVDVWVSAKGTVAGSFAPPRALVRGAEVVSVGSGGGVLSTASEVTVRLLLADGLVPQVLSAVDNGARVDVVPIPGSVPGGGS